MPPRLQLMLTQKEQDELLRLANHFIPRPYRGVNPVYTLIRRIADGTLRLRLSSDAETFQKSMPD